MTRRMTIPLRWFAGLVCVLLAMVLAQGATAHAVNQSYVYFDVAEDHLEGRIEVTTADLARVFAPQADAMPEAEVEARAQEIFGHFQDRLLLTYQGDRLPLAFNDIAFLPTESGNFAQLQFVVQGLDGTPPSIDIQYGFLFTDLDPAHRGFGLIASNTRTGLSDNEGYISLIFSPGDGPQTLKLDGDPAADVALAFLEQGVRHIWQGFDHLLFLLMLLVSSVMVVQSGRWVAADNLGQSLKQAIMVVTLFTLAHTVALGLATFDVLTLPVALAEAVIVVSIAIVAIGNLYPRLHVRAWKVAIAFGLFHGLGFASVLAPLGLDPSNKVIGLVTFNIGIELALIVAVLLAFPILFVLRSSRAYRAMAMQVGSAASIALALLWFTQQTFDIFGPAQDSLAAVVG